MIMNTLYTSFNRLFQTCNWLPDGKAKSVNKNDDHYAVYFLYNFIKSLESIPNKLSIAIRWISCFFGIFMIKSCVVFNLTSFGTGKYDSAMNTEERFSFWPVINHSVATG